MSNPNPQTAADAIGSIRVMFAVFHYMQAIRHQRQSVISDIHDAFENFDTIYAQVCTPRTRLFPYTFTVRRF